MSENELFVIVIVIVIVMDCLSVLLCSLAFECVMKLHHVSN